MRQHGTVLRPTGCVLHNTNVQNVLQDVTKIQWQKMAVQNKIVNGVQWARTPVRLVQPLALHANYVPSVNTKMQLGGRIARYARLGDMEMSKVSPNVNFVPRAKL